MRVSCGVVWLWVRRWRASGWKAVPVEGGVMDEGGAESTLEGVGLLGGVGRAERAESAVLRASVNSVLRFEKVGWGCCLGGCVGGGCRAVVEGALWLRCCTVVS